VCLFIISFSFLFFKIIAERERQELAIELARQVEENKRLRHSLLAQSAKFLTLRQSANVTDAPHSASNDHRLTPVKQIFFFLSFFKIRSFICFCQYSGICTSTNNKLQSNSTTIKIDSVCFR